MPLTEERSASTSTATVPEIGTTFDIDSPRARRTDPVTSHEAADTSDVTKSIGLVLQILTERGMLADHEIETWALVHYKSEFTGQRLRSARAALVERGQVKASGIFRLTKRNRRAIVWQVAK